MEERSINCYFCGKKAIHIVEGVAPRNVQIRCEHCKVYELKDEILLYHYSKELNSLCYTDENTGKKELPQDLKDKLSEYVRSKFDTETGKEVLIELSDFQDVTGKGTIHTRYR